MEVKKYKTGESEMATWECKDCGYKKDSRCKPKNCPECGAGAFEKEGS